MESALLTDGAPCKTPAVLASPMARRAFSTLNRAPSPTTGGDRRSDLACRAHWPRLCHTPELRDAGRLFLGGTSWHTACSRLPDVTGNLLPLALLPSCFALACGSADPADGSGGSDGVGTSSATGAGGAAGSTAATTTSGGSDAVSSTSAGDGTSTSTSTSQSSASSGGSGGGSGGATSSNTTAADNACADQPVNCIALCEAGTCQCDCSARAGCASPGWIESSLPWERFGLADQAGVGVTLCHPDTFTWSDPEQSANTPSLNGSPRVSFLAYARTDPVNALKYVSDQDTAKCSYELVEDYGVRFLNIDGWPAMEQSYVEPAPVCGACVPLPEAQVNAVANFYLAAGSLVLTVQAIAATESGLSVGILFDIAESIRIDTGETAGDTAADIGDLYQRHLDSCGG